MNDRYTNVILKVHLVSVIKYSGWFNFVSQ